MNANASTFTDHLILAMRYIRWNGGRGTEKQALKLMHQISYETLCRMCAERGIK